MSRVPLIELRGIGKRFPPRHGRGESPWILRNLSFAVADGEFVTLIGPSGSGKSTLLNVIAQVDAASEGEILFQGKPIAANPAELQPGLGRRIGYVTQEDNLLPWRSLLDNVLFPLEVQGRITPALREHARMLLATVGLTRFESYYPHELSGGMRKRTSLIRTLAYDPPVILMDEPFGALDAQTREQLQEDLLRLWEIGKKTIIFITHDITEAILLGDRTLVLSRAPASVIAEHIIPIPRPRAVADAFVLPGFVDTHEAIRAEIR